MSYQLVFHPEADKEYMEAYQWYEKEQKGLGARFERMVGLHIQQISDAPENYHYSKVPYREVSTEGFPYVIVYKINKRKKLIFISAIYHTKRNPKYKYRK